MIVSLDKRFVIFTPTKTGTFSLESSLRHQPNFQKVMPRHAHRAPLGFDGAHACVMARHPYARLVSMYTYGQVKRHSWLLRAGEAGFAHFVFSWLEAHERGKPHDWTMLISDYVKAAREQHNRVSVFPVESGGPAAVLKLVLGVKEPVVRHINKSHDRFAEHWQTRWTPSLVNEVKEVLAPDMRLGRYELPC